MRLILLFCEKESETTEDQSTTVHSPVRGISISTFPPHPHPYIVATICGLKFSGWIHPVVNYTTALRFGSDIKCGICPLMSSRASPGILRIYLKECSKNSVSFISRSAADMTTKLRVKICVIHDHVGIEKGKEKFLWVRSASNTDGIHKRVRVLYLQHTVWPKLELYYLLHTVPPTPHCACIYAFDSAYCCFSRCCLF